jgi:4-diphosphocytidyl-2-C-methyl-D-erythritol kinase
MIFFPSAKINIGLKVLFKRPDGFHELETCMLPIPFYDVLEIIPATTFTFRQTGRLFEGADTDNLCIRAFQLLATEFNIPSVYMHLRKVIPMGAGLGGGSSDAAWVLRGLNILFGLNLTCNQLQMYAAKLGSDCPFFITDGAQIAKGRGEQLNPYNLTFSPYYLKLVNPAIHIGTALAYAGVHFSKENPSLVELLKLPISQWKHEVENDFELSVFEQFPEIASIKEQLYMEGAVYAAMSGSGSTVFGIFESQPKITFSGKTEYLEVIRSFAPTAY